MRAVTIAPRTPGSLRLDDIPAPRPAPGQLLVQALAVGVCGTDRELIDGHYGEAPPGEERLVLGHESLGRVLEAPAQSAFAAGDLVVGIVRHPDPVPCANCAAGEWDMCRNGLYTERGIKQAHGFCSDFFTIENSMAVKVEKSLGLAAVLLEPASILAKAWEHIERIGKRARWEPRRVLVTGAGPVGHAARPRGARAGPQRDRAEARARPRARGKIFFRGSGRRLRHHHRMQRRAGDHQEGARLRDSQSHRLPDRALPGAERREARARAVEPGDGAE